MSLPESWQSWTLLKEGNDILLLGLGPKEATIPDEIRKLSVYWLDEEKTLWQTKSNEHLPPLWQKVTQEEALALFVHCKTFFYTPSLRLAPDFWQPFLGRLFATDPVWQRGTERDQNSPLYLLFGNDQALLHQELKEALREDGAREILTALPFVFEKQPEKALEEACHGTLPALAISVNGRGLDAQGRLVGLLQALGVPCALWFVDNPWHVLSGIKLPWWKRIPLFVTDPSFVPQLASEGARNVFFLPLAVAPHMWRDLPKTQEEALARHHACDPPLFVGRSRFPAKDHFFAAVRHSEALLEDAKEGLVRESFSQPDIHYWYDRYRPRFWPGTDVRTPGFCAEECSQLKRALWLQSGNACGMRIIGDKGWHTLLRNATILPCVDYYASLREYYYRASVTLNVTSLLLPQSLSQRHFDVWAAGGFLLSDATKGLSLFPRELTEPITLLSKSDLPARIKHVVDHREETIALRKAWRRLLAEEHSYRQRIHSIKEKVL
ncbi:MAG: glycosyltransferase [Desulfovibrio sp.]|nr:glycosyltransferase [Desulfovibrio sp.]